MNEEQDKIVETDISSAQSGEQEATGGLVVAAEVLPAGLPIIPLRPRPAFPGALLPMALSGRSQILALKQALETPSQALGLVLARDPEAPDGPANLHRVGVAGKILKVVHLDEETAHFLVNALERFTIEELAETPQGMFARVRYHFGAELSVNPELKAYSMAIIATLKELVQINPLYSEEIKLFLGRSSMDDPGRLADFAANLTSADGQELQEILATFDVRKRIDKVLVLLKKDLEVSRLQSKITKQIEEKISKQQREFFLKEQLKAIKKELGLEKEEKTAEIEKFEKRLKKLKLNDEAQKAVEEEMEKLRLLEPPHHVQRQPQLPRLADRPPWGRFSRTHNLERARRV
jgi:ATP-dependent Lon protease